MGQAYPRSDGPARAEESSAQPVVIPVPTRALLVIVGLLAVGSLLAAISDHVFGHGRLYGLVPLLSADYEANLTTWFNSLLLTCCAALALVIAALKRSQASPYRWHWFGLSAALLYVSIDETAEIHEKVDFVLRELFDTGGPLYYSWVVIGAAAVVAFGIVYRPFVGSLPPATRRRLLIALALFLGGALGLELVEGSYIDSRGRDLGLGVITTLQEVLEMSGAIVALGALAGYVSSQFPGLRVRFEEAGREPEASRGPIAPRTVSGEPRTRPARRETPRA